ncbi:MAG: MBOAT family protein, partial [Lachnospiraceae bacterium]|nr:MBOAT family protein [Lachnospiraceae bacterium]
GFRLYRTLVTFVLVDLSWVYFRAEGFHAANTIVRSMVTAKNPWVLFDGSLYTLGLDGPNFRLMIVSIFILLAADIAKRCGITIREKIIEQDYLFRWVFIACAVVFILLFGVWGPGYSAANFIYFQF